MEWKAALTKFYKAVSPTTVSDDDKIWANKEARAEVERAKKAKAEAAAAKKYLADDKLTWSPVEANKRMLKRAAEE